MSNESKCIAEFIGSLKPEKEAHATCVSADSWTGGNLRCNLRGSHCESLQDIASGLDEAKKLGLAEEFARDGNQYSWVIPDDSTNKDSKVKVRKVSK